VVGSSLEHGLAAAPRHYSMPRQWENGEGNAPVLTDSFNEWRDDGEMPAMKRNE
jgi:hypothetical protein